MSDPLRIVLREYGEPSDIALTHEVAGALAGTGLVDVQLASPTGWRLTPVGKVGAVSVGDLEVHVAPKIPIDRVVWLLEAARAGATRWQAEPVTVERAANLLIAVASAFARAADRATRSGVRQGYRRVERSLTVVRGRIRMTDQLRLHQTRALPVEVRYDDFGVDTEENRLLRAATERLLRMRSLPAGTVRLLHVVQQRLAEVSLVVRGAERPSWQPTRLNLTYQPALRLSDIVLDGSSFEHRIGDLVVSGFVLDMPKVFEDFVTAALRERLARRRGRVTAQHPLRLDEDGQVPVRPDIVWLDGPMPLAVIDAKYKAEKPAGFPQADIYQAFAYATALNLREAHLVYAAGNERPQTYTVRHAGTRITAHTLDLARDPAELDAQLDELARGIVVEAPVRLAAGKVS